jgi:hypothetical protein
VLGESTTADVVEVLALEQQSRPPSVWPFFQALTSFDGRVVGLRYDEPVSYAGWDMWWFVPYPVSHKEYSWNVYLILHYDEQLRVVGWARASDPNAYKRGVDKDQWEVFGEKVEELWERNFLAQPPDPRDYGGRRANPKLPPVQGS